MGQVQLVNNPAPMKLCVYSLTKGALADQERVSRNLRTLSLAAEKDGWVISIVYPWTLLPSEFQPGNREEAFMRESLKQLERGQYDSLVILGDRVCEYVTYAIHFAHYSGTKIYSHANEDSLLHRVLLSWYKIQ